MKTHLLALITLVTFSYCSNAQSGYINRIAGTGAPGYTGDGGAATSAELNMPNDVVVDSKGNFYISDRLNNAIRKVNTVGVITTIAGPLVGYSGDGGLGTAAGLRYPYGMGIDKHDNIYFADHENNVIRKIDTAGIITTVAGNGYGAASDTGGGYVGDGGPAIHAELSWPLDVAVDTFGNIYISDQDGTVIRYVSLANGDIQTIAGGGTHLVTDTAGMPGTDASLSITFSIAVDNSLNVYLAEDNQERVLRISPADSIYSFAGSGVGIFAGAGTATGTAIGLPNGVATDRFGNVYITDEYNGLMYMAQKSNDSIYVVAGIPGVHTESGNGGPATSAGLQAPFGISVDKYGNIYLAQGDNSTGSDVREINAPCYIYAAPSYTATGADSARTFTYTGAAVDIDSVVWSFGDGSSDVAGTAAEHIYATAGSYTACVTVYGQVCGTTTSCQTINITNDLSVWNANFNSVNVYPIPALDQLYVSGIEEKTTYSLESIIGTTVQKGVLEKGNNSISLQNYPPGMYLLSLDDGQGKKGTIKVIKQ